MTPDTLDYLLAHPRAGTPRLLPERGLPDSLAASLPQGPAGFRESDFARLGALSAALPRAAAPSCPAPPPHSASAASDSGAPAPRPHGRIEPLDFAASAGPMAAAALAARYPGRPGDFTIMSGGSGAYCAQDLYYDTLHDTPLDVLSIEEGIVYKNGYSGGETPYAVLDSYPTHYDVFTFVPDGRFYYEPEPGWSGRDSFMYRITDGDESSDPATVYIDVVNVTGYTIEWQQPTGNWEVLGPNDISWSHDTLRWKAVWTPAEAEPTSVDWRTNPWEDRTEPLDEWSSNHSYSGGAPAVFTPIADDYAVVPVVTFPGGTSASPAAPQRKIIAEITSIEWATHTDPDYAGELYDTGGSGGIQMHPDAVTWTSAARTKVDARVHVEPALAGIAVYLDWRDVDDASDHDGPIDDDPDPTGPGEQSANGTDNQENETGTSTSLPPSATTDANGQIRVTFDVGTKYIQPGNNFRVIAGARQADVDRVLAKAADSESSVFYDENGNGKWNTGEIPLDDELSIEGCVSTRLLTIWRYLYVEVDSMGAPPPGTQFPDDGLAIDANLGDIPAPDTGLLYAVFEPAYIEVVLGTAYDQPTIPFVYHVADAAAASRGIGESRAFWSAYIAGAYEPEADYDRDPAGETGEKWGLTFSQEPESSFIFFEVLRDVHNDGEFPNWGNGVYSQGHCERQAVVHEIGHQFGLWATGTHPPAGQSIMSLPQHDPEVILPPDSFSELEILLIRSRPHT